MGSLWASVMEKAYTHFRMEGANSFPSIEGGFSVDVFIDAFQSMMRNKSGSTTSIRMWLRRSSTRRSSAK